MARQNALTLITSAALLVLLFANMPALTGQ